MNQFSGNPTRPGDDFNDMTCERWHDAISAIVDSEQPDVEQRLVEGHLARCPSCRSFQAFAEQARHHARVQPAASIPDLSRRVVRLNALADRASRWRLARAMLAVVAVEIIAFALPALVFGEEHATSTHSARHLGAFSVAYGVCLLVVVVRPARARTVLPAAAVLAGALLITAVTDLANREIPLFGEAGHLPELISVPLVWLLAVPSLRRPRRFWAGSGLPPKLHAVDDDRRAG